jgi:PadR family transcriptional regulator PadR
MSTPLPTPPDANLLRGHLDLILLSIIQGSPKYGLEISKMAQDATDGYFDLKVGSLYPALHRLEKAGFVQGEFQSGPRSGSSVKMYTLTQSGERELTVRRTEFETFTQQLGKLWSPAGGGR